MDVWDREAIDLVQPGFFEFTGDGFGSMGFIAVKGELDCRDVARDCRPGVEFSWEGNNEYDPAIPRSRERPRLGGA